MATLYNIVSGSNRWRFRATTWLRWSRYCTPGWKKRKRRPETSAEIRKRRLSCRPAKRNARGRRSPLRRSAPLRPNSLSAASVRREHYRHRRKLDLKKNVVCVWFCNQRQKQKRMKFSDQQSCYSYIIKNNVLISTEPNRPWFATVLRFHLIFHCAWCYLNGENLD